MAATEDNDVLAIAFDIWHCCYEMVPPAGGDLAGGTVERSTPGPQRHNRPGLDEGAIPQYRWAKSIVARNYGVKLRIVIGE